MGIIALLKDNDTWVEATKKLPDLLMADIEDSGAKKEIKNSSIKSLDDTIRDISKTSGGHIGKLQLEMDVKEQDVEEFIRRITRAKYDVEGLLLNEESQGLGFSNLIYLHMRLEEFYKSIDKNKVNVFFIEEPESHMHPQMQNVFVRFLKNYYIDKKLQGLITTHSNEIARVVGLDSLRVIRQTEKSKSELFDLSKFRTSIKEKKIENLDDESEFLLTNFFDWFFEIGYSELIFADKAILYEGDSERLYIRKLIKLPEFSTLNDSYIAYIQVGGAYAHNYLPMLRMLKMKTLIITDLDYDKEILSMDKVKAEGYKNELAVELAKCRTLNEKILHKEIFIYDEEFKIYKEIMPGFRKASKSVLDYLVIIKLLVEKGIEDTTEGKEKIQKAYASAYEMTFAYYDLVMDEGIFIEEQTYVMLMNFFAHCEKILRINLNPENWKDMKWDEIIDNQINEENKITCHLRNKIRSC